MARLTLPRWLFSWLSRWYPCRVRVHRRPVVRYAVPRLTLLEERSSPTALNVTPPVDWALPSPSPLEWDTRTTSAPTRQREELAGVTPSEQIRLVLPTPKQEADAAPTARTTPPEEESPLVWSIFVQEESVIPDSLRVPPHVLSSSPNALSPLSDSTTPNPQALAGASGTGGSGSGGGVSTPNAGGGGAGAPGGGGGPGLVNANTFLGFNFGAGAGIMAGPASGNGPSASSLLPAGLAPASSISTMRRMTLLPEGSGIGTAPAAPSTSPAKLPASPVPTFSAPVLDAIQRFGPAGHQRLFIHGSLGNTAPLGTPVTLDFYAREPAVADKFLGSKTVTQTTPGTISFTVNLEANVPGGTLIAAAVHGRSGGPAWDQGDLLPGGPGNSPPNRLLLNTVTLPGANGESITLESPGHPLTNVQVFTPPGLSDKLPMGLVAFTVNDVAVGGSAVVRMILPNDVRVKHYYKQDPITGAVTPFDFNGRTGAEIRGNVIILHLVDGGQGDADGAANGIIVDPGGPGGNLPNNVEVLPAATSGDLVTLESADYAFTNVQTFDPPATGAVLPLGLFGFSVIGVPIGGSADVQMILPNDVVASRYLKQDPLTGVLSSFDYNGQTGAEIQGQTITLHLVDGGPGDADGLANGIIVDPGGPGSGTITIPDTGLTGWNVFQTGGTQSGQGTVTYNSSPPAFVITEGNSFDTGLSHVFTIPTTPNILTFDYSNLSFDTGSPTRTTIT